MDKIIKLDLDSIDQKDIVKCFDRICFVVDMLILRITDALVHGTKNGYHVKLMIQNQVDDSEIVMVQALMGSDLKRETFNYVRVLRHEENWNILFTSKEDYFGNKLSDEKYLHMITQELRKMLQPYMV